MNSVNRVNFTNISTRRVNNKFNFKANNPINTYEPTDKHSGFNNAQKYGLIAGAAGILILLGTMFFTKKHNNAIKKLEKLCNEKIVMTSLPDKLEFKPNENIENSIRFANETLGIKEIDKNFTAEALNDTIENIVYISNLHKGKVYLPSSLHFKSLENENLIACIDKNVYGDSYGAMTINKKFYDKEYLQKYLRENLFFSDGKQMFAKNSEEVYLSGYKKNQLYAVLDKSITPYLDNYYNNPEKVTLRDMRIIWSTLGKLDDTLKMPKKYPMTLLKSNFNRFEKLGIKLDIADLENKTKDEQSKFLMDALEKLNDAKDFNIVGVRLGLPEETIWHEMGHLQDYGKNLKDLYLKMVKDFDINAISNRFGCLEYNQMRKMWECNKDEFKKNLPDQYEFLSNNEKQELAGRVSAYAQTGIGEFIAETYSQMALCKKYNGTMAEDVMLLYKKYNGPMFAE